MIIILQILFLSLGSDVGKRTVRYRGHSEISGDYVVEDIENEKGEKFRRLYYLRTQSVIQSEAKLRTSGYFCQSVFLIAKFKFQDN